jgi:hypothetical protein
MAELNMKVDVVGAYFCIFFKVKNYEIMVKLQFCHVFYRICSGALQAAITVIAACRAPLLLLQRLVELCCKSFKTRGGIDSFTTILQKFAADLYKL